VPRAEFFQLLRLAQDLFKSLIERVEDFVKAQHPGCAATALCFPGVHSVLWFWHGTCWTE